MVREPGVPCAHPVFKLRDECRAPFQANGYTPLGCLAVDLVLVVEQRVDAALATVLGYHLLVEVLAVKSQYRVPNQLNHPRHLVHRSAPRREPAHAEIVKTLRPVGLGAITQRRKVRSDMTSISDASACLNSRRNVRP